MQISSGSGAATGDGASKPALRLAQIGNLSFGFFGIQIAFALQNANVSRIFQTLGAAIEALPILWIAGPLTGLIVQPIVGHLSDRTWSRWGRRRPYFVAGALTAVLALVLLPNAPVLWFAVACFWLLDVSINVAMEPFRAFVGDMLPERQRTLGYAVQTVFIGTGALCASAAPWVLVHVFGVAGDDGGVGDSVRLAFYIGAAALGIAVLWTVVSTREYSPEQLARWAAAAREVTADGAGEPLAARSAVRNGLLWAAAGLVACALTRALGLASDLYLLGGCALAFAALNLAQVGLAARGRAENPVGELLGDLARMPVAMRRLALVQFCSWSGLFVMWIYATPVLAAHHYGGAQPGTPAYAAAGDWVGVLFAIYNAVAAAYAFVLPALAARLGRHRLHALNLAAGAAGFAAFVFVRDPQLLAFAMLGVGMAWASILTVPYSLLCGALPYSKLGTYMGIFNFFIVLPQLVVAGVMGSVVKALWPGDPAGVMLLAGGSLALAALLSLARGGER